MIRKIFRNQHDLWVAINLTTRLGTRVITLGLLVHYLIVDELAAWYLFAAIFGLAALAEAGLGRVVTRQVADRFKASLDCHFSTPDLLFLSTIFNTYRYLVIIVCTIAFALGLWWLDGHVHVDKVPWLWLSWLFFVIANGTSLYSALYSAVLNGLGKVSVSQKNESIASLVNLVVFLMVAFFSQSLLAPTVALMFSVTTSFLLNRYFLHGIVASLSSYRGKVKNNYYKSLLQRIAPETGKYFLMLLAFHLLTSAFVLLLSHYESPSIVASYGITMQLVMLVLTFSNIWLISSFPQMAAERTNTDKSELKKQIQSVGVRGLGVLLIGMFVIANFGNVLLEFIDSKVYLLEWDTLKVILIVIAVEYFFFTLLGQLLVSQSKLRFTYFSTVGSIVIVLVAFTLFENGYDISSIFIGRICIFLLFMATPIVYDVRNVFRENQQVK